MTLGFISPYVPRSVQLEGKPEETWIDVVNGVDKKGKALSKLFKAIVEKTPWTTTPALRALAKKADKTLKTKPKNTFGKKAKKRFEKVHAFFKEQKKQFPLQVIPKAPLVPASVVAAPRAYTSVSRLTRLPEVLQKEVIKYLIGGDSENYLTEQRTIFRVHPCFAKLETSFLKGNNGAVSEILRGIFGNISRLRESSRAALQAIAPTIRTIDLHDTPLSYTILESIGDHFPRLTAATLSRCNLWLPSSSFYHFKDLQRLDLNGNTLFSGDMLYLAPLTKLEYLSLGDCGLIYGQGCQFLVASLPQLRHLSFKGFTRFGSPFIPDDSGFEHLVGLRQLQHLDLSRMQHVTDARLQHVSRLTLLPSLALEETQNISETGFTTLINGLTALTTLSIKQSLGISSQAFRALQNRKLLTSLNVEGCQITDAHISELALCISLEHINLRGNFMVSNMGIRQLFALTKLKTLKITTSMGITEDTKTFLRNSIPGLTIVES